MERENQDRKPTNVYKIEICKLDGLRMYLTKEEEKMYNGEFGVATEWSMKFLVEFGDAIGAKRLIEISSAMLGWRPAYWDMIPDEVMSDLLEVGFKVPTYTGVIPYDMEHQKEMGGKRWVHPFIPEESYEDQEKMTEKSKDIGLTLSYTCAPYMVGYCPIFKTHCSSVESSCVAYVNSVFGARTNRESGNSVYASALTGKTPESGLHLDENRKGDVLIRVKAKLDKISDYDVLGYYVGKQVSVKIPVFAGIENPTMDQLKSLGAAMATSGGVGLFHIVGATPEAPTLKAAFGEEKPKEVIAVTTKELADTTETLCTNGSNRIDLVVLGCPHYSIGQVRKVAELLRGKKIHRKVALWIFTPSAVRSMARRMGLEDVIRTAGGVLLSDTCAVTAKRCPSRTEVMASDSAKQAHYMKSIFDIGVRLGSVEDCVNAAFTQKWE
jgi:hypothetical protein